MLMALALLAVIDAVPPPVVEVALTGERGAPVSAAPRTLSDVARERREGRKAVGGFSAVETTVPQSLRRRIPPVEWESEATEAEPQIVNEPVPVYEPTYAPAWYGGYPARGGLRPRPPSHVAIPAPRQSHVHRPSAPPSRQPFSAPAGHFRRRI